MELEGTVSSIENVLAGGRVEAQVIRVALEDPFGFRPGQYAMLAQEGFRLRADPSQLKWTAYSIASAPGGRELEFVYTVKYTGGFTQYLAENLQTGSHLFVRGPYGNFVLDENGRGKVFVATGAGIAPILSMARFLEGQGRGGRLFYGFRTREHFLCRKEVERLAGNGLELFTTASREGPSWPGGRGYVQSLLERQEFSPAEEAYICGNPEMVREVAAFFRGKGMPAGHIRTEQW